MGGMAGGVHSDAAATGLASLITPCGSRARAEKPPLVDEGLPVALTFSGGGFRASLAALGVALFLEDAGLLARLRYVSGVSGGSVAAGAIAANWPVDANELGSVRGTVIPGFVDRVSAASLKMALVRNIWRTIGPRSRTDLLARLFDEWWFNQVEMENLAPGVRWIINAGNQVSGARFGFERDVVGDYVVGSIRNRGTGIRLSQAVAASAAVPGLLPPLVLPNGVKLPCEGDHRSKLVDGGTYDNTGLQALDHRAYDDVFTVALNAGGTFRVGRAGKVPLLRDLKLANSMLYRQSTAQRTNEMVGKYQAFEKWRDTPDTERGARPKGSRPGVLFALATSFSGHGDYASWAAMHPEKRTFYKKGKELDLAFVGTSFDKFDESLCHRLIYRGWWLTGAALASFHPNEVDWDSLPAAPRHE